eukprot:1178722-Prorocentrum_minimum.AAC.4
MCKVKAGPAFLKADSSHLVAVMRRTPGAAARWVQQRPPDKGADAYSDLAAFLAHPALSAVHIATPPPGAHAPRGHPQGTTFDYINYICTSRCFLLEGYLPSTTARLHPGLLGVKSVTVVGSARWSSQLRAAQ